MIVAEGGKIVIENIRIKRQRRPGLRVAGYSSQIFSCLFYNFVSGTHKLRGFNRQLS